MITRFICTPKNKLEGFGLKIYFLLVDNFPQTFFVGGMVRDLLLKRKVVDVDIATQSTPDEVAKILSSAKIKFDDRYKNFGSITARRGRLAIEITTFRKDLKSGSRYPKVQFIKSSKTDSKRRDFTINSLYLRLKPFRVLDFNGGISDIKNRLIRFIGRPENRIRQDPLRIIRALRFALILNFKLENKTRRAIKNNLFLAEKLTRTKLNKEIDKIKGEKNKIILTKVINKPKLFDNYFKNF